jgi:hypothetical protein
MGYSKLSIILCLTVGLAVLFSPFLFDVSPDGKTYASMSRSHNKSSNATGNGTFLGYKPPENNGPGNEDPPPGNNQSAPAPVPEPATLILVGGGALGLAALRKFKKNK